MLCTAYAYVVAIIATSVVGGAAVIVIVVVVADAVVVAVTVTVTATVAAFVDSTMSYRIFICSKIFLCDDSM